MPNFDKSIEIARRKDEIKRKYDSGEITESEAKKQVDELVIFMNTRQPGELPWYI